MLKFEIHCKDCIFAQLTNGVQTGCSVKNLEKFEKTYEDNYYLFQRHCNSYRTASWLKNDKNEDPHERIKQENKIRIGYAVNFIGDYNESNFKKTIKSLNNPSYVVAVNDRVEHNKQLFDIITEETKLHQSRIHVIQIINQKEKYYIDEAFRAARNGYFCYSKSGFIFPSNFYEKLNKAVNTDMKLVSVCLDDNFILFQSTLFKYLEGNKPRMLEDGTMEDKLFLEKLKSFEDHEKCVHNWKDL